MNILYEETCRARYRGVLSTGASVRLESGVHTFLVYAGIHQPGSPSNLIAPEFMGLNLQFPDPSSW